MIFNQAQHRARLAARFSDIQGDVIVALQGGCQQSRYDTDGELFFRQESNFFWVTGVQDPDCLALLRFNAQQNKSDFVLFVPNLYEGDYSMWCGEPTSIEEYKNATGASEVLLTSDFARILQEWNVSTVHALTTNKHIAEFTHLTVDKSTLYRHLVYLRLRKTPEEVEMIRTANRISIEAHGKAMKAARAGINEAVLESIIVGHSLANGCKHMAYTQIVGGGERAAVLHYIQNNKPIDDGSLVLIDAGCEFNNYAADITRTFPVNGKFTAQQREIYQIVLDAQKAVINAMKPGVSYTQLHKLAINIITEGLIKADIIRGSVEDAIANHIGTIFFPHGLGHSLGLDVHDPPNRDATIEGPAPNDADLKYLRFRGVLEPGMVMTVEPGIYFVEKILNSAFADPQKAKFLNKEKIDSLRKFGGVRIEDNILVTETGHENLTGGALRDIDEIEAHMAA